MLPILYLRYINFSFLPKRMHTGYTPLNHASPPDHDASFLRSLLSLTVVSQMGSEEAKMDEGRGRDGEAQDQRRATERKGVWRLARLD